MSGVLPPLDGARERIRPRFFAPPQRVPIHTL